MQNLKVFRVNFLKIETWTLGQQIMCTVMISSLILVGVVYMKTKVGLFKFSKQWLVHVFTRGWVVSLESIETLEYYQTHTYTRWQDTYTSLFECTEANHSVNSLLQKHTHNIYREQAGTTLHSTTLSARGKRWFHGRKTSTSVLIEFIYPSKQCNNCVQSILPLHSGTL